MKVIFIMHLVYGIGNNFFYGCIYRKVKDPHILDELTQYENRYVICQVISLYLYFTIEARSSR
jgi:hypothetical protein